MSNTQLLINQLQDVLTRGSLSTAYTCKQLTKTNYVPLQHHYRGFIGDTYTCIPWPPASQILPYTPPLSVVIVQNNSKANVCVFYAYSYAHSAGKRSLEEEEEVTFIRPSEQQILDSSVPVEPFDIDARMNAIHERRRRQTCSNGDIRHVLFIVDTSGSIGPSVFNKVRDLLASISEKLCDRLRVAMMTYSDDINLEFCFNCHTDRRDIFNAIKRVQYRGGLTHTTDATKCACDTLLTPACGLPDGRTTSNIDIVYLTDGGHNGPCRSNLAKEVQCLHNQRNINTYAIAVGRRALASVQALENPHDRSDSHVFNVDDLDDLQEVFNQILQILSIKGPDGNPIFTCVSHDGACRK